MLKLAGVEDAWSFTKGQTQTIYNFASAMFKALEKTSTTKLVALFSLVMSPLTPFWW